MSEQTRLGDALFFATSTAEQCLKLGKLAGITDV